MRLDQKSIYSGARSSMDAFSGLDLLAKLGVTILGIFVAMAIFAPYLPLADPIKLDIENRLKPPGADNPFGTDDLGRDIFSRVVWGARSSLLAGSLTILLITAVGVPIGVAAGYLGGRVDQVVMRIADVFLAFPYIVLAIAVAVALGPGLNNAMLAIAVTWWPLYARLARSKTLVIRIAPYVEAAKIAGSSTKRILVAHILPNVLTPVVVQATIDLGVAIVLIAALGFLGLGAQPPTADWGAMISSGRIYMLSAWWYVTFPGLAILLSALASNLVGDGIRDKLDPMLKR